MQDHQAPTDNSAHRTPWNKGKMEDRKRDLALFNLAIDSKLRDRDVAAVRVDDVAPSGYAMDRRPLDSKTGRPVRFELTDQTRFAIDEYLRLTRVG
jgi:integrase